MKRIEVLVGQRIPGDRVDGEVASPRRLLDRHRRIAGDGEAAMTASRFRVAPRQRHVDVAELVDLKARADRLDTAERFEQRAQVIGGDAEHFDVDVRATSTSEQPIADPAADNQRASARLANRFRNRRARSSADQMTHPRISESTRLPNHPITRFMSSVMGFRPHRLTIRSQKPGAIALSSARPRALRSGYTSGTGRSSACAMASATSSADCRGPRARVAKPECRVITSKNSVSVEIGYTTET